jgi:superfamily II DNA/RNA helicase
MLDMGFITDIRKIVAKLPAQRQTFFFSATMPQAIAELAGAMLRNPAKVAVTPAASTVDSVTQRIVHVDRQSKSAVLADLLRDEPIDRALIFTRTKHGADKLVRGLGKAGIGAEAIHGNKSQGQRERMLAAFRRGQVRIHVATNITARAINADAISHLVNYDLPNEPESYVHRIGRTARAGASGIAISLCDADEMPYLRSIEKLIRMSLPATDRRTGPVRTAQPATPAGHNRPRPKGQDRHRGGRTGQPRNAQRNAQRNGQPNSTRPNPNRGKPKPAHSGPARSQPARAGRSALADQPINDISRVAFLNREIEPRRNSEPRRIADRPE